MVAINIREFAHNLSKHMKTIKMGERIVIMERNKPIADLIPHNPHVIQPGWKRKIERIKLKGEPMSTTIIKMREEEDR
ncbi:MAG: hypothetical protein HYZ86_03600 [Candidatus Omnitrophica bacterium]|nr:hypothetical protein [Candidatus Omnitrophota bacterium]